MFAMLGNREHGERRKTISNLYAKTYVMSPAVEKLIQDKVLDFMNRVGSQSTNDVFTEFHYLGLDVITRHVYGPDVGTKALLRKERNETLLDDFIRQPKSAWLWCLVHFPELTERASTPGDILHSIAQALNVVRKSIFPYTSMRNYAFDSTIKYLKEAVGSEDTSVMSKMLRYHVSNGGTWTDKDLAAEAGDHVIAGTPFSSRTENRCGYNSGNTHIPVLANLTSRIHAHPRQNPPRIDRVRN
jgi:hypothetical protein